MKRSIYTLSMLAAALTASAQTVTLTDGTQLPEAMQSFTAMPTHDNVFVNGKPIPTYAIQSIDLLSAQQLGSLMSGLGKLSYIDNANDIMVYRALATPFIMNYGLRTNYAGDNSYCYTTSVSNTPISFIVPTDEAFKHYVDVYSLTTRSPRVLEVECNPSATFVRNLLSANTYEYNVETGEVGSRNSSDNVANDQLIAYTNRLLMAHTVLGDIKSGNRYYRTLDGNVVCVEDDGTLHGTYQIEDKPACVAHVIEEREISAGGPHYYVTDSILTPQPRSAYSVISNDERCSEFFKLWNDMQDEMHPEYEDLEEYYDEEGNYIGPEREEISREEETRSIVFSYEGGTVDYILQMALFASNTPYTMFVPSNEAILAERAAGRLDTWRQKRDFLFYHICYGSEFADKLPFAATTHRSALVEGGTMRAPAVRIASAGNGDLTVTDVMGNTRHVVKGGENIFTYEFKLSKTNGGRISGLQSIRSMSGIVPAYVAPGVIHIIDGVLRHN